MNVETKITDPMVDLSIPETLKRKVEVTQTVEDAGEAAKTI